MKFNKFLRKRLTGFMMAITMALSVVTPGFAAEPVSSSGIAVSDSAITASGSSILPGFENSEAATEYHEPNPDDTSTEVEVEIGASYTVTVPKRITLGNGMASYKVRVQGDVGGLYRVQVRPDRNFIMSEAGGRTDVLATVDQEYLLFASEQMAFQKNGNVLYGIESGAESNGTVSMLKKAGIWTGRFNFYIALVSASDEESAKLLYAPKEDNSGEAKVVGINPDYADSESFTIDEKWNGMYVTSIEPEAFKGKTTVKKIIINMSSGEIPENTFEGCTNLEEVVFGYDTMKPSVLSGIMNFFSFLRPVKVHAAEKRSLSVRANAFEGCTSLKKVVFDDSVTTFGDNVFKGCKELTDVKFGSKVESVGASVVEKDSPYYKSLEEASTDGIIRDDGIVFGFDTSKSGTQVTLSESDKVVADSAGSKTDIVDLIIPETVKVVGKAAFRNSKATNVDANEGKTDISSTAFSGTPYENELKFDKAFEIIKTNLENYKLDEKKYILPAGSEEEEREDGIYQRTYYAVSTSDIKDSIIKASNNSLTDVNIKLEVSLNTSSDDNTAVVDFKMSYYDYTSNKDRSVIIQYEKSEDAGWSEWTKIGGDEDDDDHDDGHKDDESEETSTVKNYTRAEIISLVKSTLYTRYLDDIMYPTKEDVSANTLNLINNALQPYNITVSIEEKSYVKATAGTESRYLGYDGSFTYSVSKIEYVDPDGNKRIYTPETEDEDPFNIVTKTVLTAKKYVEGSDMDKLLAAMDKIFSTDYYIGRYYYDGYTQYGDMLNIYKTRSKDDVNKELYSQLKKTIADSDALMVWSVEREYLNFGISSSTSNPYGSDGYGRYTITLRSDRTGETLTKTNLRITIKPLVNTSRLIKDDIANSSSEFAITEFKKSEFNDRDSIKEYLISEINESGKWYQYGDKSLSWYTDCYPDAIVKTSGSVSNFHAATNTTDGYGYYYVTIKTSKGSCSQRVDFVIKAPGICEHCNGTGHVGNGGYKWVTVRKDSLSTGTTNRSWSLYNYVPRNVLFSNVRDYKIKLSYSVRIFSNSARCDKGVINGNYTVGSSGGGGGLLYNFERDTTSDGKYYKLIDIYKYKFADSSMYAQTMPNGYEAKVRESCADLDIEYYPAYDSTHCLNSISLPYYNVSNSKSSYKEENITVELLHYEYVNTSTECPYCHGSGVNTQ